MKEINEMYDKIMMKDQFREDLSKIIYVSANSQKQYFKGRRSFRKQHLEKVSNCLKEQLKLDEETRQRRVKRWELLK